MSIRFFGSEFTNPLHILNPRKNSSFYDIPTAPNLAPFISILESLYTRRNLADFDNFELLFLTDQWPSHQEHEKFLEWTRDLPEEKLFALAFMQRDPEDSGPFYDNTRIHFNKPNVYRVVDGQLLIDQLIYDCKRVISKDDFLSIIEEIHASWSNIVARHASATVNIDATNISNYFADRVLLYRQGFNFLTYDGQACTAKSLKTLLYDNENVSYSIRKHPDYMGLKFTLNSPTNNRTSLHRVFNYSANVLSYIPGPLKESKEKDPPLYGVELELSTDYIINQLIDACEEPFFIAKSDGSISGEKPNLMELVTAPASLKYLKKAYAKWFSKLDYDKFDVSTETNNGMHVHVGRTHFLDDFHIRNFCWFFNNPAHAEFLLKISERGNMDSLQRWAPFYQFSPSCSRTTAFKEMYRVLRNGHLRGATNFKGGTQGTTVEVRIFRGVVSYATIVKNLEFVDAVLHFSQGLTSYRELTLQGFVNWVRATHVNRYIMLKKFLDVIAVDKMLVQVNVKDLLFNTTDPEKIIHRLNNAPFKVTGEHLKIINRGKKRTFFFNKEKGGVLDVILHDRSKLCKYDKVFAERYLRDKKSA